MVFKCTVLGCKTGYKSQVKDTSVSLHSFPLKNEDLLQIWLKNLRRDGFKPNKNSRVCSLHFCAKCILTERVDSNPYRKDKLQKLSLRRLTPDAVPTLFLGCPSYVTVVSSERSGNENESAENRLLAKDAIPTIFNRTSKLVHCKQLKYTNSSIEKTIERLQERLVNPSQEIMDNDWLNSMVELGERLEKDKSFLTGFKVLWKDKIIAIVDIDLIDNIPELISSVVIFENLELKAYNGRNQIDSTILSPFLEDGKISSFSNLLNILSLTKWQPKVEQCYRKY